jgi:hypothetical protein
MDSCQNKENCMKIQQKPQLYICSSPRTRTELNVEAAHDLVRQVRGLALEFDQQRVVIARRPGRVGAAVYLGVLCGAMGGIERWGQSAKKEIRVNAEVNLMILCCSHGAKH